MAAGAIVPQPSGKLEKNLSSADFMSNIAAGAAVGAVVALGASVALGAAVGAIVVWTGVAVGAGAHAAPRNATSSIMLSSVASTSLRAFIRPPKEIFRR